MSEINDDVTVISELVHDLTENENLELKLEIMRKIRSMCKIDPSVVSHVYHSLMTQLRKEHAEIRFIIILAINDFFLRSSLFRNLVESHLEEILELTLETNQEKLLPPPKSVASRLKLKTIHFLKDWYSKYGNNCQKLKNAFVYLKSTGKIETESEENPGNNLRSENRLSLQLTQTKQEMENLQSEILDVVNQIENCFQILLPLPNNIFDLQSDCPHSDPGNKKDHLLRNHGILDVKTSLSISISDVKSPVIVENSDNLPVLENLNCLFNKISQTYLPLVAKWLKVFSKDRNSASFVKKAVELKQMLEAKVTKYREINFKPDSIVTNNSDSDSDFEDVAEKEGFEATVVETEETLKPKSESCVRTCRALLPSGKLCPRQDKYKCPFHGVIVDRNEHGFSTNDLNQPSTSKQSTVPDWQDPQLMKDIQAATGVDLTLPSKGKKKRNKKCSVRTDIRNIKNTTYNRLFKKVFKKESRRKKR